MENLAALILLNVTAPGVAAGLVAAFAKPNNLTGTASNLLLGAVGGLFGGLVSTQALAKFDLGTGATATCAVWVASVAGGLSLIALFRGMARVLVEVTDPEQRAA